MSIPARTLRVLVVDDQLSMRALIRSYLRKLGFETIDEADSGKAAYLELGWRHTVDFDSMAAIMVGHDMALLDDPMALWAIP